MIDISKIVEATKKPTENISAIYPIVFNTMQQFGKSEFLHEVGMIATIATETKKFFPQKELYGSGYPSREAYFEEKYGCQTKVGKKLGNIKEGDGGKYFGRGLIQITGYDNYKFYGDKLGLDLLSNPDQALDPGVSSLIAVHYFLDRNIFDFCQEQDWLRVRKKVNGGTNGWNDFIGYIGILNPI